MLSLQSAAATSGEWMTSVTVPCKHGRRISTSVASTHPTSHATTSTAQQYDVAVVGAGPYGLSTAAHLRERGLSTVVFGKPMGLWRDHMPVGMRLRSMWWATSLSDPHKQYALGRYFQECGQEPQDPLPAETIVEYGLWFQRHLVPDLDETYVNFITQSSRQFELSLADGRIVHSSMVVLALGLQYYAYRAQEYAHLPRELVSHTSEHRTFERFAGKQVVVIGAGQSATESAALLHESGAYVHLIARRPIVWNREASGGPRSLKERLLSPQGGIGRGWNLWALEHIPYAFHGFSRAKKDQLLGTIAGPAAAAWLRLRLSGKVTIHEHQWAQAAQETDNGIRLILSNLDTLHADHLMLGTGYRVDINRLPMLGPALVANVQTYQQAPVLNSWFESSVPGLYFVGISSVSSYGPLFRFVLGTDAAARRVAGAVARQKARAS